MPVLDAAGARVEYEWIGPGPEAAPTIVFLHEGLGSCAAWRDFPARVAAATGTSAFVYSRAGYGGSDPRPRPWTPAFMHEEAQWLPALLDRVGVRKPILFGHSDGASIALLHAAERPSQVRALVLLAPHVFVEDETVAAIRALKDRSLHGDFLERWRRTQGPHADATFAAWTDVWLGAPFRGWTIRDHLPAIRCPVLLVQGEDDAYGTLAQVDALRLGVVGPVEARIVRHCGHAPHRDRPDETLDVVQRFVGSALGA